MFSDEKRYVSIIPSKEWPKADSLLGIMIRKEDYQTARERVLRITNVMPDSPAEKCGLIPNDDYLMGIINFAYSDLNDLCSFLDLLQECESQTLELCIYNKKSNKLRYEYLIPNKNWGGNSYIGVEFGTGFINKLPVNE